MAPDRARAAARSAHTPPRAAQPQARTSLPRPQKEHYLGDVPTDRDPMRVVVFSVQTKFINSLYHSLEVLCAFFTPWQPHAPRRHAAARARERTCVENDRVYRINRAHAHAALGCVGAAPEPPIPGGPTPCIAVSMLTRLDMHWSVGGPLAPTRASASASCWCSALTCLGLRLGSGLGLG